MKTDYAPLDIASYLNNEEVIAEYLTAAAEDEDPNVLLAAIANVAKARGMARVAEAAGLGRESLYKTLAPGSHPRFETIRAILRALNVEIAVRAPLTDKLGDVRERLATELENTSRWLAELAPRGPLTDEDRRILAAWEEIKAQFEQAEKRARDDTGRLAWEEPVKPEPEAKPAASKRRA